MVGIAEHEGSSRLRNNNNICRNEVEANNRPSPNGTAGGAQNSGCRLAAPAGRSAAGVKANEGWQNDDRHSASGGCLAAFFSCRAVRPNTFFPVVELYSIVDA